MSLIITHKSPQSEDWSHSGGGGEWTGPPMLKSLWLTLFSWGLFVWEYSIVILSRFMFNLTFGLKLVTGVVVFDDVEYKFRIAFQKKLQIIGR